MAAQPSDPNGTITPKTSITVSEPTRRERWQLPIHHKHTLRDLFQGTEESRAGIRTRYIPDGNHGGSDDEGVHMHDIEKFMDATLSSTGFGFRSSGWKGQIERAHRAVNALRIRGDHKTVGVLAAVYGHTSPSSRRWPLEAIKLMGELAPLVRFCDVTETVRVRMARERAIAAARADENAAVSLFRARCVEQDELRSLSSGDALTKALDLEPEQRPIPFYCEPRTSHITRMEAWKYRRNERKAEARAFLVAAREECAAMLETAARLYAAEWYLSR